MNFGVFLRTVGFLGFDRQLIVRQSLLFRKAPEAFFHHMRYNTRSTQRHHHIHRTIMTYNACIMCRRCVISMHHAFQVCILTPIGKHIREKKGKGKIKKLFK